MIPTHQQLLDNLFDGVYYVDLQRHAAEQISGFSRSEVISRPCSDNILIHVDAQGNNLCQSGCPLHATLLDGQIREVEAFLHHKLGHRVPVSIRICPLRDDHGAIIGAVELFSNNSQMLAITQRMKELEELALLDSLTRLANRRYLEMTLEQRCSEMDRYQWPCGLILLDIDHFKAINDEHGHLVGDEMLCTVAQTLLSNSRSFDLIGRWGGEEYVALMRNLRGKDLWASAEKFRHLVGQSHIQVAGKMVKVTMSVGATQLQPGDTAKTALHRVDQLMYASKRAGRNCTTVDFTIN
ncbi:MAG: sensor domain-containing diguanylate cyclase [Trichloromonadaceae bacterium]